MASCCCGHLLASSCSLASLSLFFRALCSLISRSFLSISLPNCSRFSLSLRTLSTKAQASSTRCSKARSELPVDSPESVPKSLSKIEMSPSGRKPYIKLGTCCDLALSRALSSLQRGPQSTTSSATLAALFIFKW